MNTNYVLDRFPCKIIKRDEIKIKEEEIGGFYNHKYNMIIYDGGEKVLWHELGHLVFCSLGWSKGYDRDDEVFANCFMILFSLNFNINRKDLATVVELAEEETNFSKKFYRDYYRDSWKRSLKNSNLAAILSRFFEI